METPHCLIGGIAVSALPNNIYSTGSHQQIDYLYSYYSAMGDRAEFFSSQNAGFEGTNIQKMQGERYVSRRK
ncbi:MULTISPECIES: hypothetical protein [unclassified Microcoleus]|uniref:hypothetical protein n=1 Tax=unclassified Microcoleus TaxID=2642155 RepID=UPI002FD3324B